MNCGVYFIESKKSFVVSKLPGKLVDVNVSSTTSVPNSKWLPCLTESQIRELQDTDEDIKQVIDWVEHPNARPNQRPPSASHVLKSLWTQKKYLEVTRGVLYRRCEDAGGGGLNKCLQLVIPPSTVPSVLSELHDSLSGRHLGVGKVLEKVRARLDNVMTWKNGVDPAIFVGPLRHLLSSDMLRYKSTQQQHLWIGLLWTYWIPYP